MASVNSRNNIADLHPEEHIVGTTKILRVTISLPGLIKDPRMRMAVTIYRKEKRKVFIYV